MTTRTPNLRGLIALAKRDGVDIRPTLVRVITDLFVQEPVHSPAEVERYIELARHMLEGVDVSSRLAVAMKLSRYPGAPREILMMLAADILEVAEPVLTQAKFAEADLLRLAGSVDEAHRRIIAARPDLPASVAARLNGAPSVAAREDAPGQPAMSPRVAKDILAKESSAKETPIREIPTQEVFAKEIAAEESAAKEAAAKHADLANLVDDEGCEAAVPSEWEKPLGLAPVAVPARPAAESLPGWITKPVEASAPSNPAAPLPSWMTKPAKAPALAAAAPAKIAPPPRAPTSVAAKPAAPLPSWMTKAAEAPALAAAAPAKIAPPPAPAPAAAKPAAPLPSWMTKPAEAPALAAAAPAKIAPPPAPAPAAAKPAAPLPSWMTKPVVAAPAATLAPAAPAAHAPAPAAPPSARSLPGPAGSAFAIADLEQAALQRKPEEFIDRLARIFELDRTKAEEVVRDPTGESVAIACRALDMSCDVFSRIVLFLDPTIGRSVALVFSLAEYYGRLSVAEANDVVASWRGPKRAAAPRHQPFTAPDGTGRHSFEPRRATPPVPGAGRIAARG